MNVSCEFTCHHNDCSTPPGGDSRKDAEKWCILKKSLCFFPQTQEVQKAMDEKKFEEAVRLRGRYSNSAPCWLLLWVETHVSFCSFLQEFWKQSDHLQTPVLPKSWLGASKRKFPATKPSERLLQVRAFMRCVCLQQQHWGLRFSRFRQRAAAQGPRERCEHTGPPKGAAGLFSRDWWRIRLWPFLLLYLRRRRAAVGTRMVNPSPGILVLHVSSLQPSRLWFNTNKQICISGPGYLLCLSRQFKRSTSRFRFIGWPFKVGPFWASPCRLLSPVVSDILLNSLTINVFIAFDTFEAFAAARLRLTLKCESAVKNLSSFTAFLSSMERRNVAFRIWGKVRAQM